MKRRRRFRGNRKRKNSITKRMLDMGRMDTFQWNLKNILDGLPNEKYRGPILATVCSKSSSAGIDEAKDYVNGKREDGSIDVDIADDILALLDRFSKNR